MLAAGGDLRTGLEALVVDAVVRAEADEAVLSRASALGWGAHGDVAVVLGAVPPHRAELDVFESVRRSARVGDMDALCATQGDRLVVVTQPAVSARPSATLLAAQQLSAEAGRYPRSVRRAGDARRARRRVLVDRMIEQRRADRAGTASRG